MVSITYNSLEDLEKALKQDKAKASLNPARFINVESMAMYVDVKKILLDLSDEQVLLSEFCEVDTTPNLRRLRSKLKKTEKSVCVLPLSEYIRVNPDSATEIISDFLNAEYIGNDSQKLRIYFLLYRLNSVMAVVENHDLRKKDSYFYFARCKMKLK